MSTDASTKLLERSNRDSAHFIAAISDIKVGLEANTARLMDMKDEIRANTQALLHALDRLGPATG